MIVVIRAATGLWEGRVHRGNQNSVCQPWGPLPFGFKDPALWCCVSQRNKLTRGACVCCLSEHTATIPVVTGSRFGRLALLPPPQARDGSEGLCRSRALWRCRQGAWEWVLERSEMGAGTQLAGMGGRCREPQPGPCGSILLSPWELGKPCLLVWHMEGAAMKRVSPLDLGPRHPFCPRV